MAWFEDGVTRRRDGSLFEGTVKTQPFRVDDAFDNDPKFLTFDELIELRTRPEQMSFVRTRHERLARILASSDASSQVREAIERFGQIEFEGPSIRVIVSAKSVTGQGTLVLTGTESLPASVEVFRFGLEPDGTISETLAEVRRFEAGRITLSQTQEDAGESIGFEARRSGIIWRLNLEEVAIRDSEGSDAPAGNRTAQRQTRELNDLRLKHDAFEQYQKMGSLDLLTNAAQMRGLMEPGQQIQEVLPVLAGHGNAMG